MSYINFLIDWVRDKNNQEHDENTPVLNFLKERCKVGVDWRDKPFYIVQNALFQAYNSYMGEVPLHTSKIAFSKKLKSLGFLVKQRYTKNKKKWCYIGIRLLTEEELK